MSSTSVVHDRCNKPASTPTTIWGGSPAHVGTIVDEVCVHDGHIGATADEHRASGRCMAIADGAIKNNQSRRVNSNSTGHMSTQHCPRQCCVAAEDGHCPRNLCRAEPLATIVLLENTIREKQFAFIDHQLAKEA
eukprot:6200713-Prymnesium_polylepis.2